MREKEIMYYAKKVIVVFLIISMIFGYMPKNIFADNKGNPDYVEFNATRLGQENVLSGRNIGISYNFKLTGVQTGFQNVKLIAKNDNDSNIATITMADKLDSNTIIQNNSSFSMCSYGNIRTGTDFSGVVNIVFPRDPGFVDYTKTITLIFSGQYKNLSGEVEDFLKEQTISFNVSTEPEIIPYSSKTDFRLLLREGSYEWYVKYNKFKVSNIQMRIPIDIEIQNETYSKIRVEIERTIDEINNEYLNIQDINTIENLKINSDAFTNRGYTVNVIRDPSGKTFIELERGQITEEYTNEHLYQEKIKNYPIADRDFYDEKSGINGNLFLDVQYNLIENSIPDDERESPKGSTQIVNISKYSEGYTIEKSSTGIKYTKVTNNYYNGSSSFITIFSNPKGDEMHDYDVFYSGDNINEEVFKEN